MKRSAETSKTQHNGIRIRFKFDAAIEISAGKDANSRVDVRPIEHPSTGGQIQARPCHSKLLNKVVAFLGEHSVWEVTKWVTAQVWDSSRDVPLKVLAALVNFFDSALT